MKSYQKIQVKRKSIDDPVACVMIFLFILGLSLLVVKLTRNYLSHINYCFLFFVGWFSWTFLEYMSHRFAWHSKRTDHLSGRQANK